MKRATERPWYRRVNFQRVTRVHTDKYNAAFQKQLRHVVKMRKLDMVEVESAIRKSSSSCLPHDTPSRRTPPLFWNGSAKERVATAVTSKGDGDVAAISKAFSAARRQTLADNAAVDPNPSSCWNFVRRFFAFNSNATLKPPLRTDGDTDACSAAERAEVFAEFYSAVQSSPAGVDAQGDLAAAVGELPPLGRGGKRWPTVGVSELRVCIASFASGRCADPFGIRSEHLRLLDDSSIALLLPFINRCLSAVAMPPHWLVSLVTPVAKRGRDLTERRSWRPVSVTSAFCRLCEMVVHNRIQHVIEHASVDKRSGANNNRRGSAQFGFRRGVGTSMPLSGLSMFIEDGLSQSTKSVWWNARDPGPPTLSQGSLGAQQQPNQTHVTLITSIDASDAFCRALPASIVGKLGRMGLVTEAHWIAALLRGRSLRVKEDGVISSARNLERGCPQGGICSPLMWCLVVDDLIAELERICAEPPPGCVAVPIVFADDINFAVRGFNPTSMVAFTNTLLAAVRTWAMTNGIPMSKLQSTWIKGGTESPWATLWEARNGEIVFDDALRCTPSVRPLKLLGVTFDTDFKFGTHVDNVLEQGERALRLLAAMAGLVKADKLRLLYRGLILSRMLYAVDVWLPFVSAADMARLESLHYRACCAITGCVSHSHTESVCYEAGMRTFREVARDEIVKFADKLRHEPGGDADRTQSVTCFGPAWVVRLFRDGAMPTAARPAVTCGDGSLRAVNRAAVWPPSADWQRFCDAEQGLALRSLGMRLHHGAPDLDMDDARVVAAKSLRPLPRAHPWPPHELQLFDSHVRFITSPPGGLVKPLDFEDLPLSEKQPFAVANAARMLELGRSCGSDAIYAFTDASRTEESGGACAGAFVISHGQDPAAPSCCIRNKAVPVSPIACTYTGELAAIDASLDYVLRNMHILTTTTGGAPYRQLALVTDSKSALESVQTTWMSRIGHLEQDVARKLYRLAAQDVHVTLAFVFSHAGGVPGNSYVDVKALKARSTCGKKWTDGLWHADTTRRVLNDRHATVDAGAGSRADLDHQLAFRFRNVPAALGSRPSEPLPREIPRSQERLLYRARLGMVTAAGGLRYDGTDCECPLCGADVLGRDGATFDHVAECIPTYTGPPLELEAARLWTHPTAAAASLAVAAAVLKAAPLSKSRAAAWSRGSRRRQQG